MPIAKILVPWNSSSSSSYSGNSKKDSAESISKYDTTFGKGRNDATKKTEDDKNTSSRITKYGGGYSGNYQRDTSAGYGGKTSDSSRIKPILDKRDASHPPVTYRPIARTGSRSRDPSPVDKSEKSSSSSSGYNYNRLYPKPFQRERTESAGSTTIPKYTGRTSVGRDEPPRYTGRTSVGRDDPPRYTGRTSIGRDDPPKLTSRSSMPKDEIPRYTGRISSSRDDLISTRFKGASKEDLSTGSKNYINSRFLPKNSVEKSHTAYTRTSTSRANEVSRKNRELLNVLQAQQEQERLSRPTSRCSSVAPEEVRPREDVDPIPTYIPSNEPIETEKVTVISRGTSQTYNTQSTNSFLRSRRIDIAKTVQSEIVRPKKRVHTMIDKEIQTDRMDDTTKMSRFAGASRISATPWTSFLDMKFSSPSTKQSKSDVSSQEEKSINNSDSPKNLSRNNSMKNISCKPEKNKESKVPPPKSKIVPPKQIDKKQLPPPIPKNEVSKSSSSHSNSSANKDFRKSILNMNPEDKSKKKFGRRSQSASSAESDGNDPDTTDVSENLTTCNSYHNSCSSKLPQKTSSDKSLLRSRRSPSSEVSLVSTPTSGSEDDVKTRRDKCKSAGSSRTSIVPSGDELFSEKSPRPPQSPRNKSEGKSETEAKSFLMRALAPVTNLFKNKQHDSSDEKVNLLDSNSESIIETSNKHSPPKTTTNIPIPAKIIIHRVESGEKPWWLESDKSDDIAPNQKSQQPSNLAPPGTPSEEALSKGSRIKHVESGEIPWWLDENADIPEGVETYPNWVREDGTTADGKVIYKIRKYDSDDTSWWLTSSDKSRTESSSNKPTNNFMDEDYLEKHKIRHIDSGERAWWQNSAENVSEVAEGDLNETHTNYEPHREQSNNSERPWWLDRSDNSAYNDDQDYDHQVPLGDRASPEGLEMPKDDEGRKSPYDNVPTTNSRLKRPSQLSLFISRHTNIDEILGGTPQIWSPVSYGFGKQGNCTQVNATQVIIHEGTPQKTFSQNNKMETPFPKKFSPTGKVSHNFENFILTIV